MFSARFIHTAITGEPGEYFGLSMLDAGWWLSDAGMRGVGGGGQKSSDEMKQLQKLSAPSVNETLSQSHLILTNDASEGLMNGGITPLCVFISTCRRAGIRARA